jgi:hypothetical protein
MTHELTIEEAQSYLAEREYLVERLIEMEGERLAELAADDVGWDRLGASGGRFEFSREELDEIIRTSRVLYLKDPLVNRAVELLRLYVWAQGVTVNAGDPKVNEVVQAFWDDRKNQAELTGPLAQALKEVELGTAANLFFACFTNPSTGRVRVRMIPVEEIREIEYNPDDALEPRYYKRVRTVTRYNAQTQHDETHKETVLYPDLEYRPLARQRPPSRKGYPVLWDAPVLHVKVGGLAGMGFGVPETLSAHAWARVHKHLLSDDATRSNALSKWAYSLKLAKATPATQQAVKARIGRVPGQTEGNADTLADAPAGRTAIHNQNAALEPVRLAGATLPTDHTRPARLMAVAGLGWPETFFGDASVGNHATAKTLDRPSELRVADRRKLWAWILRTIIGYVIDACVRAPAGVLKGTVARDEDTEIVTLAGGMERRVDVGFPDILEHDPEERIGAIIRAATLDGRQPAGTLPREVLAQELMKALALENVDELLKLLTEEREEREREAAQIAGQGRSSEPPRQASPRGSARGEQADEGGKDEPGAGGR